MKQTEFQAQIESDFDQQTEQMDMLHEEFQLRHNEFMGLDDEAGSQPDIPELSHREEFPDDEVLNNTIDSAKGQFKDVLKHLQKGLKRNDDLEDDEELTYTQHQTIQKPSQSIEDGYEYVNSPSHYSYFDMEVIDVIEQVLTHEQFKGFLMGTSMRYRFRCGSKKGEPLERDINKAKRYEQYWYDYVKRNTP